MPQEMLAKKEWRVLIADEDEGIALVTYWQCNDGTVEHSFLTFATPEEFLRWVADEVGAAPPYSGLMADDDEA